MSDILRPFDKVVIENAIEVITLIDPLACLAVSGHIESKCGSQNAADVHIEHAIINLQLVQQAIRARARMEAKTNS